MLRRRNCQYFVCDISGVLALALADLCLTPIGGT
jgi:hypothetical protein